MSGSRAAVFAHQTKSVEVYVENAWWPGSILGWRHDGEGACSVWVRVMAAGVDREIWTGLSDLRLPQVRPVPTFVPVAGVEPLPAASAAPVLSLSEAAARERLVAGVFSAPELSTVGES